MRVAALAVVSAFAVGFVGGTVMVPVITTSRSVRPPERELARAAEPPVRTAAKGIYAAEVLRVLDGDTFEARVHLWPGLDITTRVRLRGIDAPEFKARCTEERVKAEAARDALRAILDQGEVGISRVTLDKYGGRVVADASTRATPNVSSALLSVGAARRYSGGHRDGWCP